MMIAQMNINHLFFQKKLRINCQPIDKLQIRYWVVGEMVWDMWIVYELMSSFRSS